MNDSYVIPMIAKLFTSHFRLSSQPPQIDLLSNNPLYLVHRYRSSQLLNQLQHVAHAQSDQPLSITCFIRANWTALFFSKVAIPLKNNLT